MKVFLGYPYFYQETTINAMINTMINTTTSYFIAQVDSKRYSLLVNSE